MIFPRQLEYREREFPGDPIEAGFDRGRRNPRWYAFDRDPALEMSLLR